MSHPQMYCETSAVLNRIASDTDQMASTVVSWFGSYRSSKNGTAVAIRTTAMLTTTMS